MSEDAPNVSTWEASSEIIVPRWKMSEDAPNAST